MEDKAKNFGWVEIERLKEKEVTTGRMKNEGLCLCQ